ncbi:hypothetical protein C8R44DRAFT_741024 [Mycena epipterygia]|nr:hypothetical protein C8R44DRAFT_741024 [Mycena epipterygia]
MVFSMVPFNVHFLWNISAGRDSKISHANLCPAIAQAALELMLRGLYWLLRLCNYSRGASIHPSIVNGTSSLFHPWISPEFLRVPQDLKYPSVQVSDKFHTTPGELERQIPSNQRGNDDVHELK